MAPKVEINSDVIPKFIYDYPKFILNKAKFKLNKAKFTKFM